MNRPIIFLAFLTLLVIGGCMGWYFLREKNEIRPVLLSQAVPIVFFGDSLVEGVGATPGHDLPSLLQRASGVPVLNYGVSGDTTAQALRRIGPALDEQPQLVIILLGGNDFLQRVPADEIFRNLKIIIQSFQKNGAQVILIGVRSGLLGSGEAERRFEALAQETRVEYMSDVLSGLFGDSTYMSDAVHPNDAGYAKIASRLIPLVNKYFQK